MDARGDARALAEEWPRSARLEPEFFGDPVFNDTSLVVWMELPTGARRHRLLLPGDQENWTYLYARHPVGCRQTSSRPVTTVGGSISRTTRPMKS